MSERLTTEILRKKFKSNFDLCNFSINIARVIIHGGEPAPLGQVLDAVEERADAAGR